MGTPLLDTLMTELKPSAEVNSSPTVVWAGTAFLMAGVTAGAMAFLPLAAERAMALGGSSASVGTLAMIAGLAVVAGTSSVVSIRKTAESLSDKGKAVWADLIETPLGQKMLHLSGKLSLGAAAVAGVAVSYQSDQPTLPNMLVLGAVGVTLLAPTAINVALRKAQYERPSLAQWRADRAAGLAAGVDAPGAEADTVAPNRPKMR